MRRVLVVEDGREYTDAFTRLSHAEASGVAFVRASSLREARERLAEGPVDALFLDVVFDRTPVEELAGDLAALVARTGGDRARAERLLAETQGFRLLDALAGELPPGLPVVLAHDFGDEPQRLAALRRRVPALAGLPDGATASLALELLLGPPRPRSGGR